MLNLGDIVEDETVDVPFTTNDAAGGAVAPSSAFEAADVKIYKDGSATEKTTANGLAMTSPFDSITGLHQLTIDTSVDTGDSGFWEVGSDYKVVLDPDETVDGQTVVAVLAIFSIENRGVAVAKAVWDRALTGATHNIATSAGKRLRAIGDVTSGSVDDASATVSSFVTDLAGGHDDHYADQTLLFTSGNLAGMSRSILAYTDSTKLITIEEDLPEAPANTDTFDINPVHIHPVSQISAGNWDAVITAGNHNITNSAGKVLRELKESPGYEGGFIHIDTVNGAAGTENYVNGTLDNPVNNIADANTLAASLNLCRFRVVSGSSLTFAASQQNQEFWGENWTLVLGGQDVSGTFFHGGDVSGSCTGAVVPKFEHCDMNGVTVPPCTMYICGFSGNMVLGSAGDYFFYDCFSEVAGTATPSIDVGAAVGTTNVNLRRYSGGMEFKNLGQAGTDNVSIEGFGNVIANANCIGGTIAVRGNLTREDNSNGAVTFSEDARIDIAQVANGVLSEVTSGHTTAGTVGEVLNNQQLAIVTGEAVAGTLTRTSMTTDLTETTDDHYNGRYIVWTTGALKGQATDITDYDGAAKMLTFTQITEAPGAGVEFVIV